MYSYLLSFKVPSCVPLLQIMKEKVQLRRETIQLFSLSGIDPQYLVSFQDYKNELLEERNRVRLHLVDHNELSRDMNGLESVGFGFYSNSSVSLRLLIIMRIKVCILLQGR